MNKNYFWRASSLAFFFSILTIEIGFAQNPKYEMRGAWVTTVFNLDWPLSQNASSASQIADMTFLFDELARTGINAVFFQVRSESDAMYESSIEPWSRYLTGLQGRAPDPFYDPLELAIQLAHERGMELHAWMNPFRAVTLTGAYSIATNHVTNTHPEWILSINDLQILNPGIPEARTFIASIASDIVTRYDVDGVHFDDYFYPYPPNMVLLEDEATFVQYGSDYPSINDWRRDNVNLMVQEVNGAVKAADPGAKFGISPFAIWKDGVPVGISGLSSYDVIFTDPTAWIEEETVDYLVPQLYWPIGGPQDFQLLADWWVDQSEGIHIYAGVAAYRADPSTAGTNLFSASEIPAQINFTRATEGVRGNVFFRARNLGPADNQGLTDALTGNYFSSKAFTPFMDYRNTWPPDASGNLTASQTDTGIALRWDPPLTGISFANKFGVYRVRSDATIPDARDITNDPSNLIAISWEPEFTDTEALEMGARYYYAVTGVNPNSIEGVEANLAEIMFVGTDVDALPESTVLTSLGVYPNPARNRISVELALRSASRVRVTIYDVLGREVADLFDGSTHRSAGLLRQQWELKDHSGRPLVPGAYLIVARSAEELKSRPFVVVR